MKIPILHLSEGLHRFEQDIKPGALHFYRQEVYPGVIQAVAEVNKFQKNIRCRVSLRTTAHHACDRCLEEFDLPCVCDFELLFHLGKEDLPTDEEDVVLLAPETAEVDLSEWIMEQLILSIPMKLLCREDCQGICPGCGASLNQEACRCGAKPGDPRWEKLRELLK